MLLGIILLFVIGGYAIGKIVASVIPDEDSYTSHKEPNITINNYTTEQHLHVTENQLKKLSNKS